MFGQLYILFGFIGRFLGALSGIASSSMRDFVDWLVGRSLVLPYTNVFTGASSALSYPLIGIFNNPVFSVMRAAFGGFLNVLGTFTGTMDYPLWLALLFNALIFWVLFFTLRFTINFVKHIL